MATAPYFITEDQFVGSISLDFGSPGFDDDFAAEFEEEILQKLLGYQVFKELIDDLDANNDPATAKFTYLVDGIAAGWTDDSGQLRQLKGIKVMLAYLFYHRYVEDVQTHQTTIGSIELSVENGVQNYAGRNKRAVRAWNRGFVYYRELYDYMNKIESDTPDTYENWEYTAIEKDNTFGI